MAVTYSPLRFYANAPSARRQVTPALRHLAAIGDDDLVGDAVGDSLPRPDGAAGQTFVKRRTQRQQQRAGGAARWRLAVSRSCLDGWFTGAHERLFGLYRIARRACAHALKRRWGEGTAIGDSSSTMLCFALSLLRIGAATAASSLRMPLLAGGRSSPVVRYGRRAGHAAQSPVAITVAPRSNAALCSKRACGAFSAARGVAAAGARRIRIVPCSLPLCERRQRQNNIFERVHRRRAHRGAIPGVLLPADR